MNDRSNNYSTHADLLSQVADSTAERATARKMTYRDGHQDRHNREFLGFQNVMTEMLDEYGIMLRATCTTYGNTFSTARLPQSSLATERVREGPL